MWPADGTERRVVAMGSTHSKPRFDRYRDDVTDRVRAGEPFCEVEDAIELADVTRDQKAALWLFAFSLRDRSDQERDAREHLAGVANQ
jgi:hypothetical protein